MPQSCTDNRGGGAPRDLWTTLLPSFGAQSNYLHHDHVRQAGTRRSVFTVAERFSHHISPDSPGEKSPVTFPQITHTWSECNLHKIPLPAARGDLTMTPTETPPGKTLGGSEGPTAVRAGGRNVASGLDSELVLIWESLQSPGSALSSHFSVVHHFNFSRNVPLLLLMCVWLLTTTKLQEKTKAAI